MAKFDEVCGILNFVSCSDFIEEYAPLDTADIIVSQEDMNGCMMSIRYLQSDNSLSDDTLAARISNISMMNLKVCMNKSNHSFKVSNIYEIFSESSNVFDNQVLIGFAGNYDKSTKILGAKVVLIKNNKIFCSDIKLADLICLNQTNDVPIYVKKELFKVFGKKNE